MAEEATVEDSLLPPVVSVSSSVLDASTPFSPMSDRCPVSTMRDTAANASRLQKALAIANVVDELPSIVGSGSSDMVARIGGGTMVGRAASGDNNNVDDSIIQPSTSADRLSVEDMQRSLSREGSPNTTDCWGPEKEPEQGEEKAALTFATPVAERSISFAPTTTQIIFEEVAATPKVAPLGGDRFVSQFTVVEGLTKVKDGTAGMAKKLLSLQRKEADKEGNSDVAGQQRERMADSILPTANRCGSDDRKQASLNDPDWNETVCVNLEMTSEVGLDLANDNLSGCQLEEEKDDPYSDLNASKFRPGNVTIPADSCWDESMVKETGGGVDGLAVGWQLYLVDTITPADITDG